MCEYRVGIREAGIEVVRRGKPPHKRLVMSRNVLTSRSILATVAAMVERRARVYAMGRAAGVGGRARYSGGVWPDLSMARHAGRSAASAGHFFSYN